MNALMLAISGILRPAQSAIVPVGSKSSSALLLFGQGVTSQTFQAALPAACAAGDVVVLSCNGQNAQSFAWVQPTGGSTPLVNTVYGSGLAAIFLYTLAQADVDAGYVGVPCTALEGSGIDISILADVRRTVSQNALDVIGTLATGVISSSVTTDCIASSITTLADKDLLSYSLFMDTANTAVVTAPAGWTQGDTPNASHTRTFSAYIEQDTKGATGSVTAQSTAISGGADYAIVLLALRKKAPAITLSATFPTNLHVGDSGSFVLTATRVDGATGSLTIEGSPLPDGMTVGTTTDNGDDTFTATVDYDLTTVQDVTASFSATGGSVAATALMHEFDVQAAASGAAWWRIKITSNNGGGNYHVPECTMAATAGGADLTDSTTAFASSFFSSSQLPSYAFDNNSTSTWGSQLPPVPPEYVGCRLAATATINEVSITSASTALPSMPKNMVVQSSTDTTNGTDGTWVDEWTIPPQTSWGPTETRTFERPA